MERKTLAVRILAVIALVSTVLAAIGWVVFLGGFGFLANIRPDLEPGMLSPVIICNSVTGDAIGTASLDQDRSDITGPCWDPYWVVSVLSPILFILLTVKAILLIIKDELFRKFFVIHILAVIAFIITVITLCFMGHLMVRMRVTIQGIGNPDLTSSSTSNRDLTPPSTSPSTSTTSYSATVPGYINALFAGALLETLFLSVAWICHILAFLFGGMMGSQKE